MYADGQSAIEILQRSVKHCKVQDLLSVSSHNVAGILHMVTVETL